MYFAMAFLIFSMNVYDRVVPNHATETLWVLAIGVTLVLAGDLFMRLMRSRFADEASARIDVQISATLMERVLGMKLENRPASVGSFASNLRGFEQVRDFIASSTVTALIDLPFALLFVLVIAWISPWLVLPVITVFTVIVVAAYVLQHRLHELSQSTYQASAQRNATLVESLTGIETIKSQGLKVKFSRAGACQPVPSHIECAHARAVVGRDVLDLHPAANGVGGHHLDWGVSDRGQVADHGGLIASEHAGRACPGPGRSDCGLADAVPRRPHRTGIAQQDHGPRCGAP